MRSRSGKRQSIVKIKVQPRRGHSILPPNIARIACRITDLLSLGGSELSILFTDNRGITRLNQKYKRKNQPTDVLAFSQGGEANFRRLSEKGGRGIPISHKFIRNRLMGDVVVSWEEAKRQGPLYGQSFQEELTLYLIHGILHLMGYEDHSKKGYRTMDRLQSRILKTLKSEFLL